MKEKSFLQFNPPVRDSVDWLINLSKIIIITIAVIYLLGNFTPYYEAKDAYLYGLEIINLSKGTYSISNELFEDTGRLEFISGNWRHTVHGDAIPAAGIGTPIIGLFFYTIGGIYGLFYAGPILGILFLIVYERISTKLFGKYVGFLSLLFLVTCHIFFRSAVLLNTDAIAALFFIPGIYYLIKFLKHKNENHVLLGSVFFAIATLIKIPGIIYFPTELVLIAGYFVIIGINKKNSLMTKTTNKKSSTKLARNNIGMKKTTKTIAFIFIPWLIFFSFWFSYNDYYYGGPFTTYASVKYGVDASSSSLIGTLLTLEQKDFEQFKDYSKYLLPYQIPATYNKVTENYADFLGKNWPGLLSPLIIIAGLLLSFKEKQKRVEIIVMSLFIAGIVFFYTGQATEERAERGLPARFMLPALSLSLMILSYLIVRFIQSKILEKSPFNINHTKIFKNIFLVGLGLFFIAAFYFTPPIQMLISDDIPFKNPEIYASRYPLDLEGITEDSVIINVNTDWALDYNAIPFRLHYQGEIYPDSVVLLQTIISDGYDVYVFKEPSVSTEKEILIYLTENYNMIYKDYSKSFCKVEFTEKMNGLPESDTSCL